MRSLLAASALVLGLAACAGGGSREGAVTTTTQPPIEITRDVQYAPGLRADLYAADVPADGAAAKPTIVWIHGGGFITGDKAQLGALAEDFARLGYPGMAIQYRLSEGGPWFPASSLHDAELAAAADKAVQDTAQAVAWLRSGEAADRGFNGDNVVLVGYSSGGVTALTAAAGGVPDLEAAVGIAGAAINPDAFNGDSPPLHLIHGDLDDVVPITLARETCRGAAEHDAVCSIEIAEGAGHGLPFEDPTLVETSIQEFLTGLA
jgi:acetyl esterase/lipase